MPFGQKPLVQPTFGLRNAGLTPWRHDIQHNNTHNNDIQHNDTQNNDTQHYNKINAKLSLMAELLF